MKKIYRWFRRLPKRYKDSFYFSIGVVGFLSTIFTVLGVSLKDFKVNIWARISIVLIITVVLSIVYYIVIGKLYRDSVMLTISQTPVEISCGDIFKTPGLKVIGCDTHFDTRVDDIVITKKSLHGKLFLEHANRDDIKQVVEESAKKAGLIHNADGLYDFPLGTIIRYDSCVDNQTYLMLASAELDNNYKAHTNMAEYELMLMRMWKEIDRVYASNDVVIPILGTGILRFDDGLKDKENLLRCMLCTFNSSGVSLNSKVKIVLYGNSDDISLYEYKDIFNVISRR